MKMKANGAWEAVPSGLKDMLAFSKNSFICLV
jgi:hypothetical protein